MSGNFAARRRRRSMTQTPSTPARSTSKMQVAARLCVRSGSASSTPSRCTTRYCSGFRFSRIISAKSGCVDSTRIVFIGSSMVISKLNSESSKSFSQVFSKACEKLLGKENWEILTGGNQFLPKLVVQYRALQEIRVGRLLGGFFRMQRHANRERRAFAGFAARFDFSAVM